MNSEFLGVWAATPPTHPKIRLLSRSMRENQNYFHNNPPGHLECSPAEKTETPPMGGVSVFQHTLTESVRHGMLPARPSTAAKIGSSGLTVKIYRPATYSARQVSRRHGNPCFFIRNFVPWCLRGEPFLAFSAIFAVSRHFHTRNGRAIFSFAKILV